MFLLKIFIFYQICNEFITNLMKSTTLFVIIGDFNDHQEVFLFVYFGLFLYLFILYIIYLFIILVYLFIFFFKRIVNQLPNVEN